MAEMTRSCLIWGSPVGKEYGLGQARPGSNLSSIIYLRCEFGHIS